MQQVERRPSSIDCYHKLLHISPVYIFRRMKLQSTIDHADPPEVKSRLSNTLGYLRESVDNSIKEIIICSVLEITITSFI